MKRVFGLAIAYHALSLAIEQLSIKIIALQWIFGTQPPSFAHD